jgi:hypothetical protein
MLNRKNYNLADLKPQATSDTLSMAQFLKFAGLALLPLATALPSSAQLGVYFEAGNQDEPLLKLDYGTYRGKYNSTSDVSDLAVCLHLSASSIVRV